MGDTLWTQWPNEWSFIGEIYEREKNTLPEGVCLWINAVQPSQAQSTCTTLTLHTFKIRFCCLSDGEPIKLPENLETLPRADHFPTQRHRWNTNEVRNQKKNYHWKILPIQIVSKLEKQIKSSLLFVFDWSWRKQDMFKTLFKFFSHSQPSFIRFNDSTKTQTRTTRCWTVRSQVMMCKCGNENSLMWMNLGDIYFRSRIRHHYN